MQEDFLHYIWKHKTFDTSYLKTANGETVSINKLGKHNHNAGPDFFNAQLSIDNQFWAGNVEIHIRSSDWYVHNHEIDKAYDNVILHVVWEHDTEIFRKDNSEIPTLELKHCVNKSLLGNYQKLMRSKSWINCESNFQEVDDFLLNNWLDRLYIERLEQKSEVIEQLSPKELEVLGLMASGCSNKEISQALHNSEGTIKNHVSTVLSKLGVRDRTRAVLLAIEKGII